jgi:hypothetical protein
MPSRISNSRGLLRLGDEGSAPLPHRVSQNDSELSRLTTYRTNTRNDSGQDNIRAFMKTHAHITFSGFCIDARKLKHKANRQLLFRTLRPDGRTLFQRAQPYGFAFWILLNSSLRTMASHHNQKIELNHKPDETIRLATALVDRELKKSTESPVELLASLCDLLFFFPWWSLRG